MEIDIIPCTMDIEDPKDNSHTCNITFRSEVEGIATTYANLYRRVLLQNTPYMSVAGLRCNVDGEYIKNFFEVVPGLSGSLIDINTKLHNAVFDIVCDSDILLLSVNLTGKFMLSDITDESKYSIIGDGKISEFKLVSGGDEVLANVVGKHNIRLDIYFRRSIGFSHRDINIQALDKVVTDKNTHDNWIVTDSKHHGVSLVTYDDNTVLGRQTVVLGVTTNTGDVLDVISNCTKSIIAQLKAFEK